MYDSETGEELLETFLKTPSNGKARQFSYERKSHNFLTVFRQRIHQCRSSIFLLPLLAASLLLNLYHLTYFPCIPNVVTLRYKASLPHFNSNSRQNDPSSPAKNINKLLERLPQTIHYNDSQMWSLPEGHSNVAGKYWERWKEPSFGEDARKYVHVTYCEQVSMQSPHLLKQNNLYWQVLHGSVSNAPLTLYLYNAYYDTRITAHPVVRLISVSKRQADVRHLQLWCLLWFDGLRSPVLSTVSEVYNIWPKDQIQPDTNGPQIITCNVPGEYSGQQPRAVSLQTVGNCAQMARQPSNILRVIANEREVQFHPKQSIGICVKGFRFGAHEMSVRLVEWLETVRLMGADKVYFYVFGATEEMRKVLHFYQKQGLVDWRPITLAGEQMNIESLYNYNYLQLHSKFWPQELLELNDCLYRNLNRHEYLAIMDIDEMIMPQKRSTWHQLIQDIENNMSPFRLYSPDSYVNRHAYVYDAFEETQISENTSIPPYLFMQRHTYRDSVKSANQIPKSFQLTSHVYAAHNHKPLRCLNRESGSHQSCSSFTIDPEYSLLLHYRENVSPKCADKNRCAIHDQTAWRYFDRLRETVEHTLWQVFG